MSTMIFELAQSEPVDASNTSTVGVSPFVWFSLIMRALIVALELMANVADGFPTLSVTGIDQSSPRISLGNCAVFVAIAVFLRLLNRFVSFAENNFSDKRFHDQFTA